MARKLQDIQQEYTQVCTRLGEAVYQAEQALPRVIDELKNKCYSLQLEGIDAIAAEKTASQESSDGKSESVN